MTKKDTTPPVLSGKKPQRARQNNALAKREATRVARSIVGDLTPILTEKVAEKLNVSAEEALEILHMNKLDKEINSQLVESMVGGAVFHRASEKLMEAVNAGERWAIELIIKTNKAFDQGPSKMVQNLSLHKHEGNTFLMQAQKAAEALGESND